MNTHSRGRSITLATDILKKSNEDEGQGLDASTNNHLEIASSRTARSIDNANNYEKKAQSAIKTKPTSASDDFVSFPSPTSDQPTTQIVNRGGTININYNLYGTPTTSFSEKHGLAVDRGLDSGSEEYVPTNMPKATYPTSQVPPPTQSAEPDLITADGAMVRDTAKLPPKLSNYITRSWSISDIEKEKLKDSIHVMLMGSLSRRDLTKKLKNLAEAIRVEKWDETEQSYVAIEVGPDSSSSQPCTESFGDLVRPSPLSSESMDTIDSATGVCKMKQEALCKATFISFRNGSLLADPSGLRIDAKLHHEEESSIERATSGESDGSEGNTQSVENVFLPSEEEGLPRPGTTKGKSVVKLVARGTWSDFIIDVRGKATDSQHGDFGKQLSINPQLSTSELDTSRTLGIPEPQLGFDGCFVTPATDYPSGSKDTKSKGQAMPVIVPSLRGRKRVDNGVATRVTFRLRGVDEAGERSAQDISRPTAPTLTSPSKEVYQSEETLDPRRAPLMRPQPAVSDRVLRSTLVKPSPDADSEMLPMKTKPQGTSIRQPRRNKTGGIHTGKNLAPNEEVEEPRVKNCATEADKRDDQSNIDRPTPLSSDSRKCRLCRNMFTDQGNVRQANGGAPCSFHPGM